MTFRPTSDHVASPVGATESAAPTLYPATTQSRFARLAANAWAVRASPRPGAPRPINLERRARFGRPLSDLR